MAKAEAAGIFLFFIASSGASSSFSSAGVPCYLHPSADGCHYTPRSDSDNCSTTPARRESMSKRIAAVNRTLAALELQLIRLGVSKLADDGTIHCSVWVVQRTMM